MATKICSKCGIEKDESCFAKHRRQCKDCRDAYEKEYRKQYYEKNKRYILERNTQYRNTSENKEKSKEYQKQYRIDHKEDIKESQKQYLINNKEKVKKRRRVYYENNKEEIKKQNRRRAKTRKNNDPLFKLRHKVSLSIYKSLKAKGLSKKGNSIVNYLPYTIQDLKVHLESLFEDWMNWDNWGQYNAKTWDDTDPTTWTWNIDHIIAHATFHYTSMEDQAFKDCWALSNLRPYSSKRNLIDGVYRSK